MFRSALFAIQPAENQQALISQAVAWARRYQWRLDGLTVLVPPENGEGTTSPRSGASPESGESATASNDLLAHQVLDQFVTACEEAGVQYRAQSCVGSVVQGLAGAAHRVDVLLCGHRPERDHGNRPLLESILKHFPRPALLLPPQPPAGNGVLVAYDGSYQSERALASFALSGLGVQRPVTVLSLHERLDVARQISQAGASFLQSHGLTAHPRGETLGEPPGKLVAKVARELSAGLLVMGAFGRTAVWEFFFGSVTRSILDELPAPVFLDH